MLAVIIFSYPVLLIYIYESSWPLIFLIYICCLIAFKVYSYNTTIIKSPCFLLRGRDSFSPVPFYGKHIVNH
nr:MAG TPA_asm: hypothetical protein [Caudoviricetes sp.]